MKLSKEAIKKENARLNSARYYQKKKAAKLGIYNSIYDARYRKKKLMKYYRLRNQPISYSLKDTIDIGVKHDTIHRTLSILELPPPQIFPVDHKYESNCEFRELDHWYRSIEYEYL